MEKSGETVQFLVFGGRTKNETLNEIAICKTDMKKSEVRHTGNFLETKDYFPSNICFPMNDSLFGFVGHSDLHMLDFTTTIITNW